MLFNPFKIYNDMLEAYAPKKEKEEEVNWVTCEYDVPENLADELDELVANFLKENGVEPLVDGPSVSED